MKTKGITRIEYKGFTIVDDNLYGYSLIDTHGRWAQSATSIEQLKKNN